MGDIMTENQICVIEAAIDYARAAETGTHKRYMETVLIAAVGDLLADYDGNEYDAMNDLQTTAVENRTKQNNAG